jgi:hypothetical protein
MCTNPTFCRKGSLRLSLNCRQRRDLTVATALTLIVLVFIISNIFKFAINLIEFYEVVKGRHYFDFLVIHIHWRRSGL